MVGYKAIGAGILVMAITGCSYAGKATDANLPPEAKLVAQGNNYFALQLYQKLPGGKDNLFFSPYSISTALAMTYAGARGQTQEQMARVLCFPTSADALQELGAAGQPMSPEQFAQAFSRIIKDLNARGGQKKYELRVANALWGQKSYEFLPAYVQLVEKQYEGKLQTVDFVAATEQARQTINAWVEKQTNDKIKDLISPGMLDALTRLVLTNAIYFKGNWARQFEKKETQDAPFTLLDGSTVQVPMMNQQGEFGYAQMDSLQALEMPYVGEELSMVILLPKEPAGIGALEKSLTAENLAKWLDALRKREVIVAMPKFKMTSKFGLNDMLRSMGMTDAFSDAADFTGMTSRRDLFISAVIHQAFVEVNEEGTEAAAATGVTMRVLSVGPGQTPIFRADHPFLFLIRDKASGSILFLGRTMDPRT